jgi:uncharacterized delta-60 repeat protein
MTHHCLTSPARSRRCSRCVRAAALLDLEPRLHMNGTLDTSFNGTGSIGFGTQAIDSIALQPDGKIVASQDISSDRTRSRLIRLNTNGSIDNTYNPSVNQSSEPDRLVVDLTAVGNDLLLLSSDRTLRKLSGNSVVATVPAVMPIGEFLDARLGTSTFPGLTDVYVDLHKEIDWPESFVRRLQSDLSFDTTFGSLRQGMIVPDTQMSFGVDADRVRFTDYFVQPDRKVLLSGYTFTPKNNAPNEETGRQGFVVRVNADGKTFDRSFATNGRWTPPAAGLPFVTADQVALDGSGRMVVVGTRFGDFFEPDEGDVYVTRLRADGSLDTTLGGDGFERFPGRNINLDDGGMGDLQFSADGKVIVRTRFGGSMFRLDTSGRLDLTFGATGRLTPVVNDDDPFPAFGDILLTSDNKMVTRSGRFAGEELLFPCTIARYNLASTAPAGNLSGLIYNDGNGNGSKSTREAGLGDVLVWVDLNNDGFQNRNEPGTYTDAAGRFNFGAINAGTYNVRQRLLNNWRQTQPGRGDPAPVTVVAGFGPNERWLPARRRP